jgi:prepilin-type N-terminal cleavage/methylation domain-containing protein
MNLKLQVGKKIKDNEGFTMIEMLLVVLLIVVIVSMVSATYLLSGNTSRDIVDITTSMIDSRVVIYRLTKDLRESSDITQAYADSIIFKSNVDDDGDDEEVNYYLTAEGSYYELYRKIDTGPAKFVATNIIDNNLFTYYTDVGIPEGGVSTPVSTEELGNIKMIGIELKIDQSGEDTQRKMELETVVSLRNRI